MKYFLQNFIGVFSILVLSCSFHTGCFAQELAWSKAGHAGQEKPRKGQSEKRSGEASLIMILETLERHYQVKFDYEKEQLKDMMLPFKSLNQPFSDLEQDLEIILKPFRLKFKRYTPESYLIYPEKENKATKKLGKIHPEMRVSEEMYVAGKLHEKLRKLAPFAGRTDTTDQGDHIITGRILSEEGEPLPGATILEKGTLHGTVTDANGQYTLSVSSGGAVLTISFVGYLSQEVAIRNRSVLDIALAPDISALEEVVVVGYGEKKRVNVTGSVVSIASKEIMTSTNSNVSNNLSGRLPGLRVVQRTSEPGSYESTFDIRGYGAALIIVDGVPRGDFNRLDPNEIESISILKDAAAAVYGFRGANGVILVTTKKGQKGKAKMTYSGTYGLQAITNFPEVSNAAQFAELLTEAQVNDAITNNNPITTSYSAEDLENFRNGTFPSTNWQEVAMRDFARQQHHNFSASGGSETLKYFMSLGYFDEQGLWKSGDLNYQRFNVRSNLSAKISDNLSAELQLAGYQDTKNEPGQPAWIVFKSIWMQQPTIPVYANDNPEYPSIVADATHPAVVTDADKSGYRKQTNRKLFSSFALNYNFPFLEGLKGRFMFSYDAQYGSLKDWDQKYALYNYDAGTGIYTPQFANNPSRLEEGFQESAQSILQPSLSYENDFGKHHVSGLLLFERIRNEGKWFNASRFFVIDALDQLVSGDPETQENNGQENITTVTQGLVGRVNYDFNEKYLVEFSFRYDGSSNFAEGNRWGFFPGVSAGWRISEESFMRDNLPFLSNLKIRGSWAKIGDQEAVAAFQWLAGYTYPSQNYIFGDQLLNGFGFPEMSNPDISWYTAYISNLGFELSLWDGSINLEFDVFRRKREGLFARRILSLPSTVGADLPQENLNEDLTRGFELALGYRKNIGKLSFGINGNVAYTRTKWLFREEAQAGNSYINWRSRSQDRWNNIWFGYGVEGQFTSLEEIYNAPIQDENIPLTRQLPGDLKYEDYNGDGIIDDLDVHPIARNALPEINFGINLNLSWMGFDLSALFQGATNFNVEYVEQLQFPLAWGRNGLQHFTDRWRRADLFNPDSEWIPGKYPSTRIVGSFPVNYKGPSEFWVHDASYIRLKNVELGYNLSERALAPFNIQACRIFLNGFNLFTWTGIDFVDPEHPGDLYGYRYPITRNYNVGLNVTF